MATCPSCGAALAAEGSPCAACSARQSGGDAGSMRQLVGSLVAVFGFLVLLIGGLAWEKPAGVPIVAVGAALILGGLAFGWLGRSGKPPDIEKR